MIINCDITLKFHHKEVFCKSSKITINSNQILCNFECDNHHAKNLSYIIGEICAQTKKNFQIDKVIHFENAFIEQEKIDICKFQIDISQIKSVHILGSKTTSVSMALYELEWTHSTDKDVDLIFFNCESKEILTKYMDEERINHYNDLTVKHAQKEYVFRYGENLDTVCLRVSHETSDFEIKQLINLVSFYYRIPLHYFLIAKHKSGQARINCKSLLSISTYPSRVNPKDMLVGDDLGNVQEFINKANTKKYFTQADFLNRLVANYVNCQFYDPVNRFVALCISIISLPPKVLSDEKLTKKSKNGIYQLTEVKKVSNLVTELNNQGGSKINIQNINDEVKNGKFITTKEIGKDRNIVNFVQLRDEIIHGLASDEIISFLTKNDILITKLEILNFTIIANMLGFNNIQMNPYYNEFDIFSEKSTCCKILRGKRMYKCRCQLNKYLMIIILAIKRFIRKLDFRNI